MKITCRHCGAVFGAVVAWNQFPADKNGGWAITQATCASCNQSSFVGINTPSQIALPIDLAEAEKSTLYWPFAPNRNRVAPIEVPPDLRQDYEEAAKVLLISPKASAALSRRCLQGVLRENGFLQRDLAVQIDAALQSGLPSHIGDNLDAVRNIGNFAAHPGKSQHTGEIIEVEPNEAEWNLDVLDALFDFYFVQPVKNQMKLAALNAKLQDAGKPPVKQPPP